MGDDKQCKEDGLGRAATDTVVLVFKLGDDILQKSPDYLLAAIQSPRVAKAVEDALVAEAKRLTALSGGQSPTSGRSSGSEVLAKLGDATTQAVKSEVQERIEKSAAAKRLAAQLDQVKCSFDKTKVGVWINEHEKLLIIVAAGIGIGGVAALYHFRVGDKPAEWALDLAKPFFQVKVLGVLTVGLSEADFKPSSHSLTLKGYVKADFKAVTGQLNVRASFVEDSVKSVVADGKLSFKVTPKLSLTGNAMAGTPKTAGPDLDYRLGLGLDWVDNPKSPRMSLHLGLSTGAMGGRQNTEAGVTFQWKF